ERSIHILRGRSILHTEGVRAGAGVVHQEIHRVGEVVELRLELQAHRFGDGEILRDRRIQVAIPWAVNGVSADVPDGPVRGGLEGVNVEPLHLHVSRIHYARTGVRILAWHVVRARAAVTAVR